MSQDLINISVVSNFKRNKIPSFSKLESVLDSKAISQDLIQLTSYFLSDTEKKEASEQANLKNFFDHQLAKNLEELIKKLPIKSFTYLYLALNVDFIQIRKIYQQQFGNPEAIKKTFAVLQKKLLLKDIYLEKINDLNAKLARYQTSFELLTALDKIYFTLLKEFSHKATIFGKKLVSLQIDSYNLSSFFRLHKLGKANSPNDYLIENPDGISIKGLNLLEIESRVSKLIDTLDDLTADRVEMAMKKRELQHLKSAIFEGYGESVILFYVELLKIFFYDLKLIAIYDELHGDKSDLKTHLINYDLK